MLSNRARYWICAWENLDVLEQLEAVQDRLSVSVRAPMSRNLALPWPALNRQSWKKRPYAGPKRFIVNWLALNLLRWKIPPTAALAARESHSNGAAREPRFKNARKCRKRQISQLQHVGSVLPQINLTGRYSKTEDPLLSSGAGERVTSLQMNVTVPIFSAVNHCSDFGLARCQRCANANVISPPIRLSAR